MKKINLLITVFISIISYAQIPVTDVATNTNLGVLNSQIATLNSALATLNTTSSSTKIESVNNAKNTMQSLGLSKDQENLLWKIPQYLKTGAEIKGILKKEQNVISEIQKLNTTLNNANIPSSVRADTMSKVRSLLNSTGTLVDAALNILTDNSYRMEANARRQYLNEISSSLDLVLNVTNSLKSVTNSIAGNEQTSSSYKSNAQKALNKIKN